MCSIVIQSIKCKRNVMCFVGDFTSSQPHVCNYWLLVETKRRIYWKCNISGQNSLSMDAREDFLSSMRSIASVASRGPRERAVKAFRASQLCATNKVKTYIENWWLNILEVRVY